MHPRFTIALATAAALLAGALPISAAQARTARHHHGAPPRSCSKAHARKRHGACGHTARFRRHPLHQRLSPKRKAAHAVAPAAISSAPAPPPPSSGQCPNTELVPTSSNLAEIRAAILCLINQQREQHGELALVEDAKLDSAAQRHSEDMVANNYFEHTSPSGEEFQTRIMASGYVPSGDEYELGENIVCGTLFLASPSASVTAWMNSPGHRANILNGEFRQTGVGVVAAAPAYFSEGQAGATYTQDFGVLAS